MIKLDKIRKMTVQIKMLTCKECNKYFVDRNIDRKELTNNDFTLDRRA